MNEIYKCSFCNKEYDNPVDRAKCELNCDAKIRIEKENIRKEKLKKEKDARYSEIIEESKKMKDMISNYIKDYGDFSFKSDNFPTLTSLFDKWGF